LREHAADVVNERFDALASADEGELMDVFGRVAIATSREHLARTLNLSVVSQYLAEATRNRVT
jgi:hypothetical protein